MARQPSELANFSIAMLISRWTAANANLKKGKRGVAFASGGEGMNGMLCSGKHHVHSYYHQPIRGGFHIVKEFIPLTKKKKERKDKLIMTRQRPNLFRGRGAAGSENILKTREKPSSEQNSKRESSRALSLAHRLSCYPNMTLWKTQKNSRKFYRLSFLNPPGRAH